MGWFGTTVKTKSEKIKEILADLNTENELYKSEVVSKRNSPSGFWVIVRKSGRDETGKQTSREHFLVVFLLRKREGQWYHKSISVDYGPIYYDCPQSLVTQWLSLIGKPEGHAKEWHEKYLSKLKLASDVMQLQIGQKFEHCGRDTCSFAYRINSKRFAGRVDGESKVYGFKVDNVTKVYPWEV
jgi:hypothetical protein